MAIERVEEYQKKTGLVDDETLFPYNNVKISAHDDHQNIPSYIEQQRQTAAVRVKMKRQMEDAEVMRKLHEEAEKKKEHKLLMEKKAEQLRMKTEERVAELKVL